MRLYSFFIFVILPWSLSLSAQDKTEFTVAQDGSGDFRQVSPDTRGSLSWINP